MIQLAAHPICRVEHVTSLGLIIADQLSWSNHIKELCRKISSAIGALRHIRSLISQSTEEQIYNASIQPYFDYCAPVRDGLSSYLCKKTAKIAKPSSYNHGQKSWDKFTFVALFHTRQTNSSTLFQPLPLPPPPPTMLYTCTRYFSRVSTLYWGVCVCVCVCGGGGGGG